MTIQFGFALTGRGPRSDREALTTLARRAEGLGYDSVFVTDRMRIPVARTAVHPPCARESCLTRSPSRA